MFSPERRQRTTAQHIGVSVEEYLRHTDNGEAWCSYRTHWVPRSQFKTSGLGRRYSYCEDCRQQRKHAKRQDVA